MHHEKHWKAYCKQILLQVRSLFTPLLKRSLCLWLTQWRSIMAHPDLKMKSPVPITRTGVPCSFSQNRSQTTSSNLRKPPQANIEICNLQIVASDKIYFVHGTSPQQPGPAPRSAMPGQSSQVIPCLGSVLPAPQVETCIRPNV